MPFIAYYSGRKLLLVDSSLQGHAAICCLCVAFRLCFHVALHAVAPPTCSWFVSLSCISTATITQGSNLQWHHDHVQVDDLSSSKHKQLQHIEALQTLQQSLQDVCRHNRNKLEGLAILLHLPGCLSQVCRVSPSVQATCMLLTLL